jgi:hypothetical protein
MSRPLPLYRSFRHLLQLEMTQLEEGSLWRIATPIPAIEEERVHE